ncbi:transcriptional regulator [Neisseria shayeganii 871]|uniref:Transcriptional regulator n=1 Tax=Neisseria shayeganii 871 TaxID=1032488 RepID=G4CJ02_9NEIS|nr:transcriptional regulator [Neisseria shayeganii 871]
MRVLGENIYKRNDGRLPENGGRQHADEGNIWEENHLSVFFLLFLTFHSNIA